ncbi:hypothetical protein ScPMuIL_008957 [Solemya velum]
MWVFAVPLSALCLLADAQDLCGGYSWSTEGEFESPNYPDSYGKLEDCEYVINTYGIMLELAIDFDIEEGKFYCEYDYIKVYDEDGNLLDKFCKYGTRFFYGTYFKIKFHSDFSVVNGGFFIQWRKEVTAESISPRSTDPPFTRITVFMFAACGGNHWESSGNIATPGYPQPYGNDLFCEWYISPWDNPIQLNITYEIEYGDYDCIFDKIQEYDEDDNLLDKLCKYGRRYFYGTYFKIKFHSDSSVVRGGFLIYWRKDCGEEYWDNNGYISTPGYPLGNYGNNLSCEWYISSLDSLVELNVNYSIGYGDLECPYSYDNLQHFLAIMKLSQLSPHLGTGLRAGLRLRSRPRPRPRSPWPTVER